MKGKSTEEYSFIFQKLRDHIINYAELNKEYELNELHSDFEIAIGAGAKKIFPNLIIKYCIFHMKSSLEKKKNSLCKTEVINDNNLFILYKICCNLYICVPLYVNNVFDIIKTKSDNEKFNEFLTYFEAVYINRYNIKQWNYYKNYEHITNNV